MISHVASLEIEQRRELLSVLTRESVDHVPDDALLPELAETLRRQLSIQRSVDLAEGFRRRMIRTAQDLGGERPDGYYDFRSDRDIAIELIAAVSARAQELTVDDGEFLTEFSKTFRTISQATRAKWLHDAALAATAVDGKGDQVRAAEAATLRDSPADTAAQIARDVAVTSAVTTAAVRAAGRAGTSAAGAAAAGSVATGALGALAVAAGPIGLVAGGVAAYALRKKRTNDRARSATSTTSGPAAAQVRRDRQATQAVVTTCAYLVAIPEAPAAR